MANNDMLDIIKGQLQEAYNNTHSKSKSYNRSGYSYQPKRNNKSSKFGRIISTIFSVFIFVVVIIVALKNPNYVTQIIEDVKTKLALDQGVPVGEKIVEYNLQTLAYIPDEDIKSDLTFEYYSPLDSLGRCGECYMVVNKETMPKKGEKRESISSVTPTGWRQKKYDFIPGGWLYNRCHLLGWQLSSENANPRNLITGTRQFNTPGMTEYENKIASHVRTTNHNVLYKVVPDFRDGELVARGIHCSAVCRECYCDDNVFTALEFRNIYIENKQDGVTINYRTGESYAK